MYPVPYAMKETVESRKRQLQAIDEVNAMLKLGVIEKSQSPYSSPTGWYKPFLYRLPTTE